MTNELRTLSQTEIDAVSGGFACGGVCVLGGITAGIGLFTAGVTVGSNVADAID